MPIQKPKEKGKSKNKKNKNTSKKNWNVVKIAKAVTDSKAKIKNKNLLNVNDISGSANGTSVRSRASSFVSTGKETNKPRNI